MVIRSSVVSVHSRLTGFVILTVVFLGLTTGSWEVDGQLQAPVPSASQEENRGPGFAHLKLIQDSVTALADSLAEVSPANCDTVTCDSCSQDECLPLNGPKSCANVSHNVRCTSYYPNCSASIKVTFNRSSTAYPRARDGSGPDYPQARTICGTVRLDPIFQTLYRKNPYHAEYYVGFPDGSRRSFPGREEADPSSLHPCTAYDCRVRPWYNAAVSNRSHLVILVDARRAEPLDASYTEKTDTLTFAKDLASKLLATMSAGDRVNIVPFSSAAKATALETESVEVKFNWFDPQTHAELEPLQEKLNNVTSFDDVKGQSSNLKAGLQEAFRLFGAVEGMMTRNVVLFTSGDISYDNSTLEQLYGDLIRLFVFSTKTTGDKLRVLDAVATNAGGLHVRLPPTTPDNAMYEMRAYFSYLADLQVLSRRTRPFWTPPYRDYYDIGEIITVVAPAFSKSEPRRLIGVAAIDVLYEELGDIRDDFELALSNRPDDGGFIDASIFRSISMTVYNDKLTESCDRGLERRENALCKPDRTVNPKEEFRKRFCCSECSGNRSPARFGTLQIALLSALLGFLFSLILAALWCWRRRRSAGRVVEGDIGTGVQLQDKKLESGTPTARKSSDSLGLGSPRGKKLESAKSGGHRSTTDNSSGTPLQIRQSVMRFGVEKFTSPLQEAKFPSRPVK